MVTPEIQKANERNNKISEIVAMNKIYKKEIKRLNERNAEMLEAFYKIHSLESITDIERICESIIEKKEEVVK